MLAQKSNKPIFYFKIENPHKILPATYEEIEVEEEIQQFKHLLFSEACK